MLAKIRIITSFNKLTFQNKQYFSPKKSNFVFNLRNRLKEYEMKRSAYLNIALCCLSFGLCFAGIPIYRTFCEHMGLVGDSNKKEYTFAATKINNMKKYHVKFTGEADHDVNWQFDPVQKEVVLGAGETAIVFYRLYNKEDKPIVGFSTYNISPQDCNVYFSKIQCFCFNQQLINPKEQLLLPLFFYLEPEINQDPNVCRIDNILVAYNFLKSAKQNLAKFAEQQLKRVQENKKKLNGIRAKKMSMSLEDYLDHLERQQMKNSIERDSLKQESLKAHKTEELNEVKYRKDFQEDVIKAELISKQFQIDDTNYSPAVKPNMAAS